MPAWRLSKLDANRCVGWIAMVRERLARLRGRSKRRRLRDELREIARRCAQLPTLDDRSSEEILGYDERGLPR
jgi:antitoxin VapB